MGKTKKTRKGKNGPIKNSSPVPELKENSIVKVSNISPVQDLNETDTKPLNPEVVEDNATMTVDTTGGKNDAIAIVESSVHGGIDSEESPSHSRTRKKRNRGGKKIQERQRLRVMVVDEEVDIQNECASLGEANQSQLNLDILYVKDLGQGMTRGMMDLGRLFHGYYVPPDRRFF